MPAVDLAAEIAAESVFTDPVMLVTKVFNAPIVAGSTMDPVVLRRARPFASPIIANSSSTDAVDLDLALESESSADSQTISALSRARPLASSMAAGAVMPSSQLRSTDGMLTYAVADSDVTADMFKVRPLAAAIQVTSFLTVPGGQPEVFHTPKPNVPLPLPVPEFPPLRIVPNTPNPPEMGLSTPSVSTRRRGL